MGTTTRLLGLAGLLLLSGVCMAQDQDPGSPKVGNKDRGREILSILGPKPHDAAGISPLQQQELNRRIRCAATRQEIQDQLDFEAAGSPGFYVLAQLRAAEREICNSPSLVAQLPSIPPPIVETYAPPRPMAKVPASAPVNLPPAPPAKPAAAVQAPPQSVKPTTVQTSPSQPPARPAAAAQAPPTLKPAAQLAVSAPAYTPMPVYPQAEKAAGHEGNVMVQLVVNPDGSIKAATVAKSSTFAPLDAAALTAARTWRVPGAAGKTIDVLLKFTSH